MSLSKTMVIGRLTKDPEVKDITMNGETVKVANFSVAVDEDRGDGTDFYDVVAWRNLAQTVGQYLGKGRLVYVEGRTKTRSYDKDVNGTVIKIRVSEIRADKVQFLDRPDNGGNQQSGGYQQPQQTQPQGGPAPF